MGKNKWNKLGVVVTSLLMVVNTVLPSSAVFANEEASANSSLVSQPTTNEVPEATSAEEKVAVASAEETDKQIETVPVEASEEKPNAAANSASSSTDSSQENSASVVNPQTGSVSERASTANVNDTAKPILNLLGGVPVKYTDLLTNIAIKASYNNEDVTASAGLTDVRLVGRFDASKYLDTIKSGDYFEVVIPQEFLLKAATKPVVNVDNPNETFGTMTITPDPSGKGGILKIVFNETVEGRLNLKGTFNVQTQIDLRHIPVGETTTVTIENTDFKIKRVPTTTDTTVENELLYKNGIGTATQNYMSYSLRLNRVKRDLQGQVVISDEIDTTKTLVTFIPASFEMFEVIYDSPDSAIGTSYKSVGRVDLTGKLVIAEDGMSFKITLNDVGTKSYILRYHTTTPGDNTVIGNTARISENGTDLIPYTKVGTTVNTRTYHSIARTAVQHEGATGQGDLAGKIRITKVDDLNKSIPIAGVKFTVTSQTDPTTVHTIVTDEQGYAITPALPNGKYIVKEVETKSWYILDETEHVLTVDSESPTLINIFNKRVETNYEINKVWEGGKEQDRPIVYFQLMSNVKGSAENPTMVANQRQEVAKTNGTYTFSNLPKYTADGSEIEYSVIEVDADGNNLVGTTFNNYAVTYHETSTGALIKNKFISPKTDFTIEKIWVGGPAEKPEIQVQLFRNGQAFGEPVTLPNGTTTYTWTGLDAQDANGNLYQYSVDEVVAPENYTKDVKDRTITNTYESPKTEYTGKKQWVGGPATKPEIQLQLFRDGVAQGDHVTLPSGTVEYTWTNLDQTDANGKVYVYTVDEVAVPVNYEKTINGDTVVNKYISPKTEVTVTKKWVNGPEIKPEIQVQLFRDGQAFGDPVTLLNGTVTYTWTGLDKTDGNGTDYVYTVDEVTTPNDYIKTIDGNTVTNTYTPGVVSFTVTKEWVGGDVNNRPEIKFQLLQDGKKFGDPLSLTAGNTTLSWNSLPATSIEGKAYTYSVEELPIANYQSTVKDLTKTSATITNKYESPKTEVTMTKVWVDGPVEKPEIQVQLMRDGQAYGDPVTLADGTTSHTWTELDLTDGDGKAYVYTVDEVAVPANYIKTVEGLTITNKYESPKTEVTMTKVWVDGPAEKPEIQVQLFRDGQAFGSPVTLTNGTTSYSWKDLEMTDSNGQTYEYTVDEVSTLDNYIKTVEGTTITNTYESPKTEVTLTKVWVDGPETRPDIQVQLFRDGLAYGTPVTLTSGTTSYSWKDLDVTDSDGNMYEYTVDELKVPTGYVKTVDGFTITNKWQEITVDPDVDNIPSKPTTPTTPGTNGNKTKPQVTTDTKKTILPRTGTEPMLLYTIVALAFLSLGGVALKKTQKK